MSFWDWLNASNDGSRFWYGRRVTVMIIVFVAFPMILYMFIAYPTPLKQDDDSFQFGFWVLSISYYIGMWLWFKFCTTKKHLNKLLDILLLDNEEEAKQVFYSARDCLKKSKTNYSLRDTGVNRIKWFGIYD